jgi:hypothetical protein
MVFIVYLQLVQLTARNTPFLRTKRFPNAENAAKTPFNLLRQENEKNFIFLWDGPIKTQSGTR